MSNPMFDSLARNISYFFYAEFIGKLSVARRTDSQIYPAFRICGDSAVHTFFNAKSREQHL